MKQCGAFRENFRAKAAALHREAMADELRWLEERRLRGQLSEPAYLERRRDVVKVLTESGAVLSGGPESPPGSSGATPGPLNSHFSIRQTFPVTNYS